MRSHKTPSTARTLALPAALLLSASPAVADGGFHGATLNDDVTGAMAGILIDDDAFGWSVDWIGDLNQDGVPDLVAGAPGDDGSLPGYYPGAIWVLFMNADGTIQNRTKLVEGTGFFTAIGTSISVLGDVDGDGVPDVASGSAWDSGVWIYFLNANGTLKNSTHLAAAPFPLSNGSYGADVAGPGDVNGDGTPDLVTTEWDTGDVYAPALVHVHFLNPDGTVKNTTTIGDGQGGFLGQVYDTAFGASLCGLGDINGDGTPDIAVGAPEDSDGAVTPGVDVGALWVLQLNPNGTVKQETKIGKLAGNFDGDIGDYDDFGATHLSARLDLDGDGRRDLIVPEYHGHDGFVLFLNHDGSVRSEIALDSSQIGTPEGPLRAAVAVPDMNGDGVPELVFGDEKHSGGGDERGAVYVGFFEGVTPAGFGLLGCDQNQAGSLAAAGVPTPGDTVTFTIDNPLGTQSAGSLPFLALSLHAAAPAGGCGVALPGYHMDPTLAQAELLVLTPLALPEILGAPWAPGQPSEIPVAIPALPELLGVKVYGQGLLFDPIGPQTLGLTRGRTMQIGI